MTQPRSKDLLIKAINWWWYPATLVPVVALFLAGAYGYLPQLVSIFALFLLLFWLSSLGFAIYATLRKKKEPRQ